MANRMWERILYSSRWDPKATLALATRALDLKNVKTLKISLDPLHPGNESIREFWYQITLPTTSKTNAQLVVKTEIRNDGQPPYFVADLVDKRRVVFKTAGMLAVDVMRRFNRLLGNPEMKGMEEEVADGPHPKRIQPF